MSNSNPTTAPYGSWRSPITADAIVAEAVGLGQVTIDGDAALWTESRLSEGGRNVVVRMTPDGHVTEVNPPPFNARTRVHEYGGGAWLASGGVIWFSNFDDQRIYRVEPSSGPVAVTPDGPLRYADAVLDSARNRLICVREDHTDPQQHRQHHRRRAGWRQWGTDGTGVGLGFCLNTPVESGREYAGLAVLESSLCACQNHNYLRTRLGTFFYRCGWSRCLSRLGLMP